jgi:hypothetical protein
VAVYIVEVYLSSESRPSLAVLPLHALRESEHGPGLRAHGRAAVKNYLAV